MKEKRAPHTSSPLLVLSPAPRELLGLRSQGWPGRAGKKDQNSFWPLCPSYLFLPSAPHSSRSGYACTRYTRSPRHSPRKKPGPGSDSKARTLELLVPPPPRSRSFPTWKVERVNESLTSRDQEATCLPLPLPL